MSTSFGRQYASWLRGFIKPLLEHVRLSVHKHRHTSVFFVLLMVFYSCLSLTGPLISKLQAESAKTLLPLDQAKHLTQTPPQLASVDKKTQQSLPHIDPKKVGNNHEVVPARKLAKQPKETKAINANQSVTTFTDGSKKVETSVATVNETVGRETQTISKTATEDVHYAQKTTLSNTGFSRFLPFNSKVSGRAYDVKSQTMAAQFQTLTGSDGIRLSDGQHQVTIKPVAANDNIRPIKKHVGSSDFIIYQNVWPNVDLEYEFLGTSVKEYILIKSAAAPTTFVFQALGGSFEKRVDGQLGIKGTNIAVEQLSLSLYKQGPVSNPPLTMVAGGKSLAIELSRAWLKQQPKSAFPALIDPDYYVRHDVGGDYGNFKNYKSDGYSCDSSNCWMNVGSLNQASGGIRDWHTEFYTPYNELSGRYLDGAYLHTSMKYAPGMWSGYDAGHTVWITWAPAFNYNYGGGAPVVSGTLGTDNWFDVTSIYKWLQSQGGYGGWLVMWGEEGGGNSFKVLDPSATVTDFYYADYNAQPTAPGLVTPTDQQVFTDTQPSFQMTPSSDANGDTLRYWFRIMGSKPTDCNNPTNILVDSGLYDSLQWTTPDGVLKDGETYWFCGYVYDQADTTNHYAGGNYWNWTTPTQFKVDLRLGKNKTQTYDTAGPFSVDYSTGNTTMSAHSNTMSSLGGSIGVNLEYNSPYASRPGLDAAYYPNTSESGNPVLTRVDGNIDFNWQSGSPSYGVVPIDNFSARWSGYFVAPETGSYTFGSTRDDYMKISVNNKVVQETNCCAVNDYSNSTVVSLSMGQVVPIQVDYNEQAGAAYASLVVKTPSNPNGQVVPRDWLRTAPKPVDTNNGLTGRYYKLESNDPLAIPTDGRQPFMTRTDGPVDFNWGTGPPVPGALADRFAVRWSGYVTVPQNDNYQFCVTSDDGMRLSFDNTVYTEAWVDRGATQTCGAVQGWKAGETHAITLDYYDNTGGAMVQFQVIYAGRTESVSSTWLTPGSKPLPSGWALGIDPDGNVSYEALRATSSGVNLYDSTGEKHFYTWTGSGYQPPVNESGTLVHNADGSYKMEDSDGRTYEFDTSGLLIRVTSPQDDRQPAALKYQYGGSPAHIQKISDGVDSARFMSILYSGDSQCPTLPSGFNATPANMLCATRSTDGGYTYFFYKAGNLARIETNGGVITDLAYDAYGRIISVREPLANDTILASVRANDTTVTSQIYYDTIGRATNIYLPAATAGATRMRHTYTYLRLPYAGNSGISYLRNEGDSMPKGYEQRVEYDQLLRVTAVYDKQGLKTSTQWDPVKDLSLSTTGPTGLMTTSIFNSLDQLTDSYGPAPTAWFDSTTRLPTTTYASQVPHTRTAYDEGLVGAAVAWYNTRIDSSTNQPLFYGAPKLHTTGLSPTEPSWMGRDFHASGSPITVESGNDSWGFSATGMIQFPATATYTFNLYHDDAARVWVNDTLLIDDWNYVNDTSNHNTATFTAVAGKQYRFRFDYANRNANVGTELWLAGQGITDTNNGLGTSHWAPYLSPDYSLVTSTTSYDTQLGNVVNKSNYGTTPELGLTQNTTLDSGGLNLITRYGYETPGAGSYLRQTSKTLPGGNYYIYRYYAATQTMDNPCTTTVKEAYHQGGAFRGKTEPDPDKSGPLLAQTTDLIYDDSGQVVATRTNSDPWTCTTYDSRGRIIQTVVPDKNGRPGRTLTTVYASGGNPLISTMTDSVAGTTTTEIDLLGRTIHSIDYFGNESFTTYDSVGRITKQQSLKGTEELLYDAYDRQTDYKLDGTIYAHSTYDSFGRLASVTYPATTTSSGSLLKLETIKQDTLQRSAGSTYRLSDNSTYDETTTMSQSGNILTDNVNFGSKSVNNSYSYDKVGRLTTANIDNWRYSYGFSPQNSTLCSNYGAVAGFSPEKNSNRTSYNITNTQTNQVTSTNYCYNNADELTYTSDTNIGIPTYDDHGNTKTLGSGSAQINFGYDATDQNISITQGQNKVEYLKNSSGAVLAKKEYQNGTLSKIYRNVADGSVLMSCDLANQNNCGIADRYISLPGNVLMTLSAASSNQVTPTYSIKNFHSDTTLTINATGAPSSGVMLYDPFGGQVLSATFGTGQSGAKNSTDGSMGWAADPGRKQESLFSLGIIQMGERVYIPSLGRFLQVDPIEGGTANAYVYAADPVNKQDYSGQSLWFVQLFVNIVHAVRSLFSGVSAAPNKASVKSNTPVVVANFARGQTGSDWSGKPYMRPSEKEIDAYFKDQARQTGVDKKDLNSFKAKERYNEKIDRSRKSRHKDNDDDKKGPGPGNPTAPANLPRNPYKQQESQSGNGTDYSKAAWAAGGVVLAGVGAGAVWLFRNAPQAAPALLFLVP